MNKMTMLFIAVLFFVNVQAQNVGIGVSQPLIKIDAEQGSIFGTSKTQVGQHDILNRGNKVSFGTIDSIDVTEFAGMNISVVPGTSSGNASQISFHTWEANTSFSRPVMTINGSGTIGINTIFGANPDYRLHVIGSDNQFGNSGKKGIRIETNSPGMNALSIGNGSRVEIDDPTTAGGRFTVHENGNVGIGTAAPATSAKMDVSSTTQGFLPPRMTDLQRNAITNPVAGLIIYCTNCLNSNSTVPGEVEVYNGVSWTNFAGGSSGLGAYTNILRDSIQNPINGLTIYCTNCLCDTCTVPGQVNVYNGFEWTNLTGGTPGIGTVTLGGKIYTNKNVDVATYTDGTPIPEVTDSAVWRTLKIGAWCWYNNDSATYAAVYGRLYNFYAVIGRYDSNTTVLKTFAPAGWKVPDAYSFLIQNTQPSEPRGCNCKELGTTHWNSPNEGITIPNGFHALPGGYRAEYGQFLGLGTSAKFWTSSGRCCEDYLKKAISYGVRNTIGNIQGVGPGCGTTPILYDLDQAGYSIRLVKD